MTNVNIRIKEICKEKGMTLEALANKLGILRTSLAQAMSRDSYSTTKLEEIAKALDVPMWQLFASADEVMSSLPAQSHDGCICPKCGARLRLTAEEPDTDKSE